MNKTELLKNQKELLSHLPGWKSVKESLYYFDPPSFIISKDQYKIVVVYYEENKKYLIKGIFDDMRFINIVPAREVKDNKTWKEIANLIKEKILPSYYRKYSFQQKKLSELEDVVKQQRQKLKVVVNILETEIEDYHDAILNHRGNLNHFGISKFGVKEIDIHENGNFSFHLENIPFHIAVEITQFLKRKMSDGKIQNRSRSTTKRQTKKADGA